MGAFELIISAEGDQDGTEYRIAVSKGNLTISIGPFCIIIDHYRHADFRTYVGNLLESASGSRIESPAFPLVFPDEVTGELLAVFFFETKSRVNNLGIKLVSARSDRAETLEFSGQDLRSWFWALV